jgi:uncharacterized lipoprotein YajG
MKYVLAAAAAILLAACETEEQCIDRLEGDIDRGLEAVMAIQPFSIQQRSDAKLAAARSKAQLVHISMREGLDACDYEVIGVRLYQN